MYNSAAFSPDLKKNLPLLAVCCNSLTKKTAKVVIHDVDVDFLNAVAEICLNISPYSREKLSKRCQAGIKNILTTKTLTVRRQSLVTNWSEIQPIICHFLLNVDEKSATEA